MFECFKADLTDEAIAKEVIELLDGYANDFFGGNEPLSEYTRTNLINELRKLPTSHVFLARDLENSEEFVGLAMCFEGFSTFACKPLINIHDFYVKPQYRRKGISSSLIFFIEEFGRKKGCCKITLEVLQGNTNAKAAYTAAGFEGYAMDPSSGTAEFWQKKIHS